MKRCPNLELLHRLLNFYRFGGRLGRVRVFLRREWRGPRFAAYVPGVIFISAPWYEYHLRARGYADHLSALLLHEMTHQAAHEAGVADAGERHEEEFWGRAPAGTPGRCPAAPGFLATLPPRYLYRCPGCTAPYRTAWALPRADRACPCGSTVALTARRAAPGKRARAEKAAHL